MTDNTTETPTDDQSLPPIRRLLAITAILAALYVPQSWYFLMDYSWNEYRLSWLKLFPGLPVFCPVVMLFHPNWFGTVAGIWVVTAAVAFGLYVLSRKSRIAFWIALIIVCLWSTFSGVVAHAMFRA